MATPLPAVADSFFFSAGNPDGKIATAARPESSGKFEIETGDDFPLVAQTSITGATFTGLLTGGAALTWPGRAGHQPFRRTRCRRESTRPLTWHWTAAILPRDRLASRLRLWVTSRQPTASNLAVYIQCLVKLQAATVLRPGWKYNSQ
jgi:hypothetical protein